MAWTKLTSWHEVELPDKGKTLCGLAFKGELKDAPVAHERTCENCYAVHIARQRNRREKVAATSPA